MIKILLADGSDTKIVDALNEIPEVETEVVNNGNLRERLTHCDALILNSETPLMKEDVENAGNLKLIIRQGNKLSASDVEIAGTGNVELRNTPNATAVSVAEYSIAVLLGICRSIGPVYSKFKKREKYDFFHEGVQLSGKIAGIIGYGRIGKEVGSRLKALGMEVNCFDFRKVETATGIKQTDLSEVLIKSDIVMIHLPVNDSSVNMISAKELALLKSTAIIVDMSGGSVIDRTALMEVLKTESLYGVALNISDCDDTIGSTLCGHNRVFPAPQLGESTKEARELAGYDAISHVREFFNV